MDGVFGGIVTAVSLASDAIAITLCGYTESERERIDKLMTIFNDRDFCKTIVRIESKKRRISLTEIKSFNAALQRIEG